MSLANEHHPEKVGVERNGMGMKNGPLSERTVRQISVRLTMRNVPVGGTGVWPVAVVHFLIGGLLDSGGLGFLHALDLVTRMVRGAHAIRSPVVWSIWHGGR